MDLSLIKYFFCAGIWKSEIFRYTFVPVLYIITYQERQRDFGPMKPWQPIQFTQLYEGANSDHENGKIRRVQNPGITPEPPTTYAKASALVQRGVSNFSAGSIHSFFSHFIVRFLLSR
jgi:hypothetical protein